MRTYKAAVIGCSRMGAFIDNVSTPHTHTLPSHALLRTRTSHRAPQLMALGRRARLQEIPLKQVTIAGMADDEAISTLGIPMRLKPPSMLPYGHSPAYEACERTELVAGCDLRPEVREEWGKRFGVSAEHVYADYKEMLAKENPEIVSVCTQPEHRAAIIIYAAQQVPLSVDCSACLPACLPAGLPASLSVADSLWLSLSHRRARSTPKRRCAPPWRRRRRSTPASRSTT